MPWIFFSSAVTAATESISGAAGLVTMVYFPRELLVTASVLTKLADLGASALILIALLVYYSIDISLTVLWVPVIFVIQLAFTLGLSLPLAALNVYFRDVKFLVGVGLNLTLGLPPELPVAVEDPYLGRFNLLDPELELVEVRVRETLGRLRELRRVMQEAAEQGVPRDAAMNAEFDALLSELQQMSADHFGADPEAVLWGEAANLEHWNSRLRQVTDAYFKRGEFAP